VPEEADPASLSDYEASRPGAERALEETEALKDRVVYDANGERLGRVSKCFLDEGRLVGCEVHLDHGLRQALGVERHVADIKTKWMGEVAPDGIRLTKAAAQVVLPPGEVTPERRMTAWKEGSDTFPRKTR
jgi:hypothetical protein